MDDHLLTRHGNYGYSLVERKSVVVHCMGLNECMVRVSDTTTNGCLLK